MLPVLLKEDRQTRRIVQKRFARVRLWVFPDLPRGAWEDLLTGSSLGRKIPIANEKTTICITQPSTTAISAASSERTMATLSPCLECIEREKILWSGFFGPISAMSLWKTFAIRPAGLRRSAFMTPASSRR